MGHHFNVGDEVVIKFGTWTGRHGLVTQLQPAFVCRVEVAGLEGPLFFSEQSLMSADETREHLPQRLAGVAAYPRLAGPQRLGWRGRRRPTTSAR